MPGLSRLHTLQRTATRSRQTNLLHHTCNVADISCHWRRGTLEQPGLQAAGPSPSLPHARHRAPMLCPLPPLHRKSQPPPPTAQLLNAVCFPGPPHTSAVVMNAHRLAALGTLLLAAWSAAGARTLHQASSEAC